MPKVTQPLAVKSGFQPRLSRAGAQVSNTTPGSNKTGDGRQCRDSRVAREVPSEVTYEQRGRRELRGYQKGTASGTLEVGAFQVCLRLSERLVWLEQQD